MIKWLLKILPVKIQKEKKIVSTLELGKAGEDEAVKFLKRNRVKVLERNIKIGRNEIDIIAMDKDEIVFIEVKTCRNEEWTYPENKVNYKKQESIRKTAHRYLRKYKPDVKYYRFDIIAITQEPKKSVHWIKNAF